MAARRRHIATRIAAILPILFGVSVFIFLLMHLAPGDVTSTLLGPMASDDAKAQLRVALGLDQSAGLPVFQMARQRPAGRSRQVADDDRARSPTWCCRASSTPSSSTVASMILAMGVGFGIGMYRRGAVLLVVRSRQHVGDPRRRQHAALLARPGPGAALRPRHPAVPGRPAWSTSPAMAASATCCTTWCCRRSPRRRRRRRSSPG